MMAPTSRTKCAACGVDFILTNDSHHYTGFCESCYYVVQTRQALVHDVYQQEEDYINGHYIGKTYPNIDMGYPVFGFDIKLPASPKSDGPGCNSFDSTSSQGIVSRVHTPGGN
jgi:hypothetical protein